MFKDTPRTSCRKPIFKINHVVYYGKSNLQTHDEIRRTCFYVRDPGKHVRTRVTQEQGGMEGRLMVRKIALVGRAFLQCAPEKVFVF
jgi:hypothetical protein